VRTARDTAVQIDWFGVKRPQAIGVWLHLKPGEIVMLELRAKCQVQSVIRQADFVLKERLK